MTKQEKGRLAVILIILIFIVVTFATKEDRPPTSQTSDLSQLGSPENKLSSSKNNGNSMYFSTEDMQADLEIINWNWYKEYDYAHVTGQVKNITNRPLRNVEAVAQFYTEDGEFVKSSSALVDYNPILPGQTSPFNTLTTDNPEIARASIEFKFLLGGTISTIDARSRRETQRDLIKSVQTILNNMGYNAGPVDGIYGRSTQSAIIKFQRDKGLAETGELSPELLKSLEQGIADSVTEP